MNIKSLAQNVSYSTKVLFLALILSVGISTVSAQVWNPPPGNPPANNAPTPINVSSSNQTKSGGFWSQTSIGTDGGGQFNGVLNVLGKITGSGQVQGAELCIGADCRNAWPVTGITSITAGSGVTVTTVGNTTQVSANPVTSVSGMASCGAVPHGTITDISSGGSASACNIVITQCINGATTPIPVGVACGA